MRRKFRAKTTNRNPDILIEEIISLMESRKKIDEEITNISFEIIEEIEKKRTNASFIKELVNYIQEESDPDNDKKLLDFLIGLKPEIFSKICATLKRMSRVRFHVKLGRYIS